MMITLCESNNSDVKSVILIGFKYLNANIYIH